MTKDRFIAGFLFCLLLTTLASAQGGLQGDPQARMKLRENISTLYLLRLTRALELNEEQTGKLFPVLIRIEKEKAEAQRRMNLGLMDLKAALEEGRTGEARIVGLVGRIQEDRRAIRQKDEEAEAALDAVLTPAQKARYLIFTVEFYRTIGRQLERARQMPPAVKRRP